MLRCSLLVLLMLVVLPPRTDADPPPNIVLILADDLGAGDLGCTGHPTFRTPRLDALAQSGARMTTFNTPTAFCAPTRASLMTGRYPFRCGMTQNPAPDGGPAADALALPAGEILLPQILKQAGYTTGMIGKWHLGHKPGALPTDRGFDEYYGIPYSNDMRPVQVLDGTTVVEYPVVQATLTERYTQRAEQFLAKNKAKPFFLYFAHAMPHKPLATTDQYYQRSGHGLYADVMAELDASIGRVLDALNAAGVADNTLVIFTSDNGPWYGGRTGGLRGMKGSTYEGGHRVPLIARWPGRIPAGHVNHAPAVMMDVFATILAATETKLSDDRVIDGRSLLPQLTGAAASAHDVLVGHQGSRLATIRDARWKLHVLPPSHINLKPGPDGRWLDPRAPDGVTILAPFEQYNLDAHPGVTTGDSPAAMQLFDLQTDPAEQHDVAVKFPDEVRRLKSAFDAINKDVPAVKEVQRVPLKK
jgi:arylsulfatase A-like enzyme